MSVNGILSLLKSNSKVKNLLANICYYCYHIGKCLSVLLPNWICQKDYHTGKYLSVLLRHWQVNVSTYLIGKYLSELLPRRQVFVSAVTTLTSACLYCMSKVSNVISQGSICLNCDHTSNYLSILLPYWQVYVSSVTTLTTYGKYLS